MSDIAQADTSGYGVLMALALAETVRRVSVEVSRVERGVIDRDLFYERVADEIVSLDGRISDLTVGAQAATACESDPAPKIDPVSG